jgi:hypothetical protein
MRGSGPSQFPAFGKRTITFNVIHRSMSRIGQKQAFHQLLLMSALPQKVEIRPRN